MNNIKKIYLDLYILVFALYTYLDKGIAYTYLAEGLLVTGVFLILLNYRSFEFAWDRRSLMLLFFLLVTCIYIGRGILRYGLMDVVRDSFMFNYLLFAFIIFLFKDDLDYLVEKICVVYKWFPLVECVLFLLASYFPVIADIKLFGGINLIFYKYGDMSVQLFVATILLLSGYIKMEKRFVVINAVLITYLYLIAASYSRAGMLSYALAFILFIYFSPDKTLKTRLKSYLKYVPFLLLVALCFYLGTNVKENFQGRKLSVGQLQDNVGSIFGNESNGTLSDNKVWRLTWWAKIIDYTFGGEYLYQGKGLGMSLAKDDDITIDEEELRSPHNFHLNVLARFGVPFFFLWLYWLYLHFRKMRSKKNTVFDVMILTICFAFVFNASFDVYLENPMGAFPFWTFVGIGYATDAFSGRGKGLNLSKTANA